MAQAVEVHPGAAGHGHDDAHGEHGGHGHAGTGIENRKLMMWLFLASDCMFFGSLIATYMIYRNRAVELGVGPFPHDLIDIPFTSVSAAVLLMSSLTMVLSLGSLQQGNVRNSRIWLAATAILGATFLGGQFFEFTEFHEHGLTLQGNIFGSSFFVLTGFHGVHVGIGVLWLISLLFVSLRGGLKKENAMTLEIAGLYWHFVDIVWIIIFTLVYLLPYAEAEGGSGEHAVRASELAHSVMRLF
ncbi:MAG: cytochrome c oxidase subunit 3 [Thermomicrobiales bacterium]|nr:cytochrome c oxidase subunit 3 [Thermomicrobiales bacterium]